MEIKEVSDNGIKFLVREEGEVLHPYLDSVGIPTIGIGCTYYENGVRVSMSDPAITQEYSRSLFKHLLKHYEQAVWGNTRDDINQNQFDALTSLCFNIGIGHFKTSTVLRKVNFNPADKGIRDAFLMWNKGTDPKTGRLVVLKGLAARRKREGELFFT